MNDAIINFKSVSKVYHPHTVGVQNITLRVRPGEFISIVGASGTGKTTLVKLLIAEERPTHGSIVVGGWDITRIRPREIPILRRQIGVVFQDFKLLPQKTVFENVAFALEVCGVSGSAIKQIVPQVLRIVGVDGKADRYPRQLSGGEAQRVVVARSLVHRPKILVADEPTGNLDTLNTKDIISLLTKINEFGTTVLLVTHNREVVNALKKRVLTLDGGQIVADHEEGKYVI
ncbi:ATP-binding cassette domain-containing protein [Candidatus Uhrbacteria bacterium]|nr:ATP-binding cassette domain-containing protein [Candidatus Uhrbacteria bacterium]